MHPKTILPVLAGLILISGCKGGWSENQQVVAWVNDQPIYLAEYQENLEKNWSANEEGGTDQLSFQIKLKSLEEMIEQNLVLGEAKRLGIKITEPELNSELEQLINLNDAGSGDPALPAGQAELLKILAGNGMSREKWKAQVAQGLLIRKTLDTVFKYQIDLSDQELKNYYEKYSKSLILPERVRARQILLTDEKTAQEVLNLLRAGADFQELARKYSKSPEAKQGGDLGWVERGQLPAVLEENIFKLKSGAVSELIKSQFGYHLLMAEERSEARQLSFEEAQERIRKALLEEKKKGLYQAWIRELWKKSRIKINYQLL